MFSTKKTLIFDFEKAEEIHLHMCFVFFSIDVLLLNKNKKIVEIRKNFKPFTFYSSKRQARYVVELPTGHKYKFKIGDKVEFK